MTLPTDSPPMRVGYMKKLWEAKCEKCGKEFTKQRVLDIEICYECWDKVGGHP